MRFLSEPVCVSLPHGKQALTTTGKPAKNKILTSKSNTMKEAIRNILPLYRISRWKIILLGCLLLGWIALNIDAFQNTAMRLFFTYDIQYWQSFSLLGEIPSFFNNFFAQFQGSVLGIFITQSILAIIYLACAYRVGGRYSIFMLPLWFILMPSTQNAEQEFAFGILASLSFLAILFHWISCRESHKQSSRFYYETFYLKYWIYYVLAGCALFFFFGTPALLFLGAIVLYRLIILLASIGSQGSENMESATLAFGIYFITAVGITFAFPRFLNIPDCMFQWTWIEWTAFGLFIAAIVASLTQNTLKRNLHNPYPLSWLFLVCGSMASIVLVCTHRTPLVAAYIDISNACQQGHFQRVLNIGESYFKKHPQANAQATDAELGMRFSIGAYTRLGLLMQGELNARFLEFNHIKEMQGMFPSLLPYTNSFDYAYARLYYETELYGSAIPLMNYTLDHYEYEQRIFKLLIPIETATYQRALLNKHLPLLKKSFGNRKFAKQWEKINADGIAAGIANGPQPMGMGIKLNNSQTAINQLIIQKVEYALFDSEILANTWSNDRSTTIARNINQKRPLNLPALDYYSLLCLLEGKIELTPILAEGYARLDAVSLPPYLQEAILINSGLLASPEKESEWSGYDYMGFRFDPQIIDKCLAIARQIEFNTPPSQMEAEQKNSYTYYYLTQVNRSGYIEGNNTEPYCPNN